MTRQELIDDARALGRDGFIARHPDLFLVIRGLGDHEHPVLAFATALFRSGRKPRDGEAQVFAVAKAPGNPYTDRISVGRARNCDLVLRHESISKLHAVFHRQGDGALALVDAGSRNGTFVNGAPLAPQRPHPLVPDDVLQFGSISAELVDAAGLFDLLSDGA